MIIQIVLSAALLAIIAYALSQRRKAFGISVAMAFIAAVGLVMVWAPELSNDIAHAMGVGRGADLVLYCFVVLMMAAVLNLHLRLRSDRETITELARAIAILTARVPEKDENRG